jgi:hypothetical protein
MNKDGLMPDTCRFHDAAQLACQRRTLFRACGRRMFRALCTPPPFPLATDAAFWIGKDYGKAVIFTLRPFYGFLHSVAQSGLIACQTNRVDVPALR